MINTLYIKKTIVYILSIVLIFVSISYSFKALGYNPIHEGVSILFRLIFLLIALYLIQKNNIHYTVITKHRYFLIPMFTIILMGFWGMYRIFDSGTLNFNNTSHLYFLGNSIVTGFFEEFTFRVLIFSLTFRIFVKKNVRNQLKAVLIASMCFSLVHFINFINQKTDIVSSINQMLFAFYIGILFQSLYIKFGSILFVSFLHGFINFFAGYNMQLSNPVDDNSPININWWEQLSDWATTFFIGGIIIIPIAYLIIRKERDFTVG